MNIMMNAIILLLLVYIAAGDGQGSDYDQELENILTEIEEREVRRHFSAPETSQTTPINTMTKGVSKADCEIQLKDYCDKLQLECLHADVVYIYGGEKNTGNCFLHFEEELHGLQAKNIKQMMKNVEKTKLSSNSKKKYVSTALDREVVAFATQKDATWGLSRIGDVNRATYAPWSKYPFEHENYGEGVRVFVVDTGMDEEWVKKEEFAGRVEAGADFTNEGVGVKDRNGHGTHCAGTVLGKKHGVAKKATLVPVKVFKGNGKNYNSWTIRAMEWIQKQCEEGVPCVVSASYGSPKSTASNAAVNNMVDSGIVFVVAAGNNNGDACYRSPASAEKAITVGSVDHNLRRSSFSNHGKCVDIWAPGSNVLSTVLNGKTGYESGTSMATPHVSGVVAAYISQSGETNPTLIKEKLLRDAAEGVIKYAKSAKSGFVQLTSPPPTGWRWSEGGESCQSACSTVAKVCDASRHNAVTNADHVRFVINHVDEGWKSGWNTDCGHPVIGKRINGYAPYVYVGKGAGNSEDICFYQTGSSTCAVTGNGTHDRRLCCCVNAGESRPDLICPTINPGQLTNLGCYKDTSDRAFSHRHSKNHLSLDSCSTYCQARGSQYMGYENGNECYCSEPNDNVFRYGKESNCNDGKGGRWSLNIYRVPDKKKRPTSARPTSARPTSARPTSARPTSARPTSARPTSARPTSARPTSARPTSARPTTTRPTSSQPTGQNSYQKLQSGSLCQSSEIIISEQDCQAAAKSLALPYSGISGNWRLEFDYGGCLYAADGRNEVYFNTAIGFVGSTAPHINYLAICKQSVNHKIWKIGRKGEVCDDVCGDLICESAAQTALTTNQLVAEAFREAGYECNGFHEPREYEGSPFATERDGEDCAPFDAESNKMSSCSENAVSHHRPLCRCTSRQLTHLGCYKDTSDRAFSHMHSQNHLSLDSCSTYCQARGSQYMGYENGNECFCSEPNDNVFRYGKESNCKDGKGGHWSLNIYLLNGTRRRKL